MKNWFWPADLTPGIKNSPPADNSYALGSRRLCTLPPTHHPPFYCAIHGKPPFLQCNCCIYFQWKRVGDLQGRRDVFLEQHVLMWPMEDSHFGSIL